MRTRLALVAFLLTGALAGAGEPMPRVYVVTWASAGEVTPERRALIEQLDRRLRDELRRHGATVTDRQDSHAAIVLRPSLEVKARSLRLNLVGTRGADQKLLGSVSMKAAGSSREAQLRALVTRACLEAELFE